MADKDKKEVSKGEKERSSPIDKTFSRRRGVIRVVVGLLALLLWIFIGVSPTIIFTSGMQEFIGVFSFFIRYPILFLLIALFNIFLGAIVYVLEFYGGLHFILSGP